MFAFVGLLFWDGLAFAMIAAPAEWGGGWFCFTVASRSKR
jgi:hypothetical protein